MAENDQNLLVWILTLPGWDGEKPEKNLNTADYRNPDLWPGGWTHFQNAHTVVVAATAEQDARHLAAQEDCPIWLDPLYALCRTMSPKESGVIFMVRSGADNE